MTPDEVRAIVREELREFTKLFGAVMATTLADHDQQDAALDALENYLSA